MKTLVGVVALSAALLGAAPAQAASISFNFGTQFSNATLPGGPGPWMVGSLNDSPGNGDLLLTLNTNGLTGTEFISGVYFSLNPLYDPSGLNVAVTSDTTGGSFSGAQTGVDAFQADGDGKYDLLLDFNSSPPRFGDNQTITFLLSHTTQNLVLSDFAVLAAPGGGNGPYYAAAHLQGIGPSGALSTWIATSVQPTQQNVEPVPEPASLLMLGTGLLGLARGARRRFKRQTVVS